MSSLSLQSIRDNLLYAYGYLQGRSFTLPRSASEIYALLISRVTSFVALPLPFLSFLALPFYGGTSTTINFVFFYLIWTAFVASHDPLTVELGGTLIIRLLFFLLPAFAFLAFDVAAPNVSKGIKAKAEKQLPSRLDRQKLSEISAVATINILLGVALQGGLELLSTEVLHLRSLLKVTALVPLPWSVAKDVLRGLVLRGILRYGVHRFVLHRPGQPFSSWHTRWQHSVQLPFSLVAAYDHPINYLISQWLPAFLPAYLFRFHVLTWHIFLAIASLEELFVYSGYAILPSAIIVAGMARRTDAHFEGVHAGKEPGNFGHLGLLDFALGTTCKEEADVVDDLKDEAVKHHIQQRAEDAVQNAMDAMKGSKEGEDDETSEKEDADLADEQLRGDDDDHAEADRDRDSDADHEATDEKADQPQPTQRRSGRQRKARG